MSSTATLSAPISAIAPATVVLDTNVVLDWLVFRNPCCAHLDGEFLAGRLRWLVSTTMRDELAHVLGRGVCDAWSPDLPALWAAWERFAVVVEPIAPMGAAARMRCTDADDQKFIDLALAH